MNKKDVYEFDLVKSKSINGLVATLYTGAGLIMVLRVVRYLLGRVLELLEDEELKK